MSMIRRFLGVDRFYDDVKRRGETPLRVVETERELESVRASVRQSIQRIESKSRVFDSYAGKMRLMREDGE